MKKVSVVGLGLGNMETLTVGGLHVLKGAELLIGAARLLDGLPEDCSGERVPATRAEEICSILQKQQNWERACIIMSGDIGLFSGAKSLLECLNGYELETVPGVSSVQYLAAKLQRPWQGWRIVSAHGVGCDAAAEVQKGGEVFFLTGGQNTAVELIRQLCDAGLSSVSVTVGQRLSYPDEQLVTGSAAELHGREFDLLSVLLVSDVPARLWPYQNPGIPDDQFVRGAVPMTKQEVRVAALAKLGIAAGDTLYDIGAGTGSVSVEMALLSGEGHVFAIEQNEKALSLIEANRTAFSLHNLHVVNGSAPEALLNLPAPDAVFIGGSGGRLEEILRDLLEANDQVRVCTACITLETLNRAVELLGSSSYVDFEVCQIFVSRAEAAGGLHLMRGHNPVFLVSAKGAGR